MKVEYKIFILALLVGACVWVAHGALDYYFKPGEGSFWDLLLLNVPAHEMYARSLFVVTCAVLGLVAAVYARRRRLAAEALRKEGQEKNAVLESMAEHVVYQDRNHRVIWMNKAAADSLEAPADQFVGRPCHELWGQRDTPCPGCPVKVAMETGEPHEAERTTPDGRAWLVRGSPVKDERGRVTGAVEVTGEITGRRRAEEALRAQRDFAESLVDTARVVILILDGEGKVVRFNPFAQELTGYSEEEALGKDWFATFLPDDDRPRIQDLFRTIMSGVPARGIVNPILARDGRRILVRWYNSLLRDAQGNVIGVLSIGHDITEIREKEEQLRQAVKMEGIGRLAGGIAHDFNNMMAIIRGYADLLAKSVSDEQQQEDVGKIRTAAGRAAGLTKQLLAFSRRQVVQPRTIQLNDVILGMDSMLRRVIGEDVELNTVAAKRLWPVTADPAQIEQVILNLVVNAREAMPDGGKLTIRTANATLGRSRAARLPDVAPGKYAVLSVSDTGVGMTDEVKAHVFEPFFTTKEVGEGTGLGLATCYGIIKQNDGHIEVESEPGKGATFRLYLPRSRAPAEKAGAEALPPAGRLREGRETILVAEDEEPVRQLIVRVLREAGYTVLETANAREALPLGEHYEGPIHLLVTDVIMPGTGGKNLAARLTEKRPDMKVLYISGYAGQLSLGQEPGLDGAVFLAKPFSPGELTRGVRKALGRRGRKASGPSGSGPGPRAGEKLPKS